MQDGLALKPYAPDGSYVESNSYWSYGTNNLFKILAALHSLIGTDLGLHYTWGLDKTCYYAINTESAEYVGWNYHDGSLSAQGTSMFYPFGYISGDKNKKTETAEAPAPVAEESTPSQAADTEA